MDITLTDEELYILEGIQSLDVLDAKEVRELVTGAIRLLGGVTWLHTSQKKMTHPFDFRSGDGVIN